MADAKDAIGATARIFWLYQGLALAAALLAFLPDRSASYAAAIAELRRLEAIQIGADDVDSALKSPAFATIGKQVFIAVHDAAVSNQLTLSSGLADNSTYFLIDRGPQSLNFRDARVSDDLAVLAGYSDNPRYVIVVPAPAALRVALQAKFVGQQGVITDFSIPCNYAPDRCQADVFVNPNGDVVGAANDLQFYVPRARVTLPYGVKDLVEARYPALKNSWLDVTALTQVQDDVAELKPAEAIAKLQELRKADDRPLAIFDVSLSGPTARLAAPVVLAILAFAAWASASGLARLRLGTAEIGQSLFLPLIETRPAAVVRIATLAFPLIVSEGLLLKAWGNGLVAWVVALCALVVQVVAALALFRVFTLLRAPETSARRLRVISIAASGLVTVTTLGCIGWSAMSPTRSDPLPPPRPLQAPAVATPATLQPPSSPDDLPEKIASDLPAADVAAAETRKREGGDVTVQDIHKHESSIDKGPQ